MVLVWLRLFRSGRTANGYYWIFNAKFLASTTVTGSLLIAMSTTQSRGHHLQEVNRDGSTVARLFLSGDVMLGRGVDQILPYHVNPVLYEGYVNNARDYVDLAVQANGPLPDNRSVDYVWGDAIQILNETKPDVRIINLETSVTDKGEPWPGKGIHYRMHPNNVPVIQAAGIQCCVLSNNHVLDWGYAGLADSLHALKGASINVVGAGNNLTEAQNPAVFDLNPSKPGRILIFGAGSPTAGVLSNWKATPSKGGVHYFDETNDLVEEVARLARIVRRHKTGSNDVVVYSLHWGDNWGWDPETGQQEFARRLIDEAQVDIVYGHSSHHIKGVEVYHGKLIAYGCGDLLTDYEGIKGGYESRGFRDDLSLMYFADVDVTDGRLRKLQLAPMRLKRMQIRRATGSDEQWLYDNMKRECHKFGANIERDRERGFFTLILS